MEPTRANDATPPKDWPHPLREAWSRLTSHPLARKVFEEDAQAKVARRRELIAALKAAEADQAKRLPVIVKERAAAEAVRVKASAALEEAIATERRLVFAEQSARSELDRVRANVEAELRAIASPLISEFLDRLDEDLATVRRSAPDQVLEVTGPQWEGKHTAHFFTTTIHGRPRAAWVEKAVDIRARAVALAMEALSEDELTARLEQLRTELTTARVEAA